MSKSGAQAVLYERRWRTGWRRFRKHRLALVSLGVVVAIYLVALFADFIAPLPTGEVDGEYANAPPQRVHLIDESNGDWRLAPFVYGYKVERDPESYARTFEVDRSTKYDIKFFAEGEDEYKFLGLIPTKRRLIQLDDPDAPFYVLGADALGRDLFSRVVQGTRVSMSIGLLGVAISMFLGVLLGGLSGYFGGGTDTFVQRLIEFLMSIPTLPLWLGLAAAVPRSWDPLQIYLAITVVVSILAWTELARVVRGRFLSLREEEFVMAAQVEGAGTGRIIFRHMLPSFTSHIIASLTLAIPAMILAETALSFLGLGLQPPVVSWGVLLQDAQSVQVISQAPWLLVWPGVAVAVSVLALNFLGDGIRDAADPYEH